MATRVIDIENQLWSAADQLRANSNLSPQEYSLPVLGLIFLRYADFRFGVIERELAEKARAAEEARAAVAEEGVEGIYAPRRSSRRILDPKLPYQARGIMYVPPEARYDYLLNLPESEDVGRAVIDAMRAIERDNSTLRDVLPKNYNRLSNDTLKTLLKIFNGVPMDIEGDAFGRIYEYFLAEFARTEGQRGGEFFTPTSVVRLIVEIIEPYRGLILDPACGSGGMFVQSARFMAEHRQQDGGPRDVLSIYGQERVNQTVRLARMNLAVHGLEGDIKQGNSYYEDPFNLVGRFDFVMANPPFNVNGVNREDLKGNKRFPFGMPNVDNGNYLWIQMFYSALNETGRAGFVMANSASDARHSELEIRRQLIESGAVDIVVSLSSNFFYTVTLPVTLWFLDKGKRGTPREDTVLFIDARKIFRQVSRAVRDFTEEQLQFIADLARLYRGERISLENRVIPVDGGWGSVNTLAELFPDGNYVDVLGLCNAAHRTDIESQGWSLNPGRYVGFAKDDASEIDFSVRLGELYEEFQLLTASAHSMEQEICDRIDSIFEMSQQQ
ncbi:MAG: type I restriction-modification system subunit M [Caldilinea sp.]|nr:SAM-dependent DNA methyltransferase [Caldilineaceae bacterium]MCO5211121.1 type I restriction-modification system subunit M [Caldilinea sp.]MCW5844408.1 SAM-dependent DNA methyltransferase [Caldilinea sp.]